jgi:tetratricopeptide (TPR) repeat protein
MKRAVLGLVAGILLSACASHEKAGDRAVALGDWKSAYSAYRQALANDPGSAELKVKYDHARDQALQDAKKRAQTCAQVDDWNCALAEADFALSLDGSNPELATFRVNAATRVALGTLDTAAEHARSGQFREAVDGLQRATQLSQASEVKTRAEEVRRLVTTQGRAAAESFRQQRNLIAAHELAQLLASQDSALSGWAQGIAAEYEQWVTVEYERLAQEGDAARMHRDWPVAQERYRQALSLRQGGRAAPLDEYVGHILFAEQHLPQRDWHRAADGYRSALNTGQDDGYARQQLERVEVRPYRVALRSMVVMPTRPDGNAWVGMASPLFNQLARRLTQVAERRGMSETLLEMASAIPQENQPPLRVEVVLPDGTRLTTPRNKGIFTGFNAEFITLANDFDEQRVLFEVFMDDARGSELVGMVEVPVRELVGHRDVVLEGRSILALKLSTTRGDGREPGSFQGMARVQPMPPPGTPPPGHVATPVP